ncbi:MAG TPA: Rid family hydrolase [Phycisphaerae bacterium]|nr:Rid family hydrolase [Phycisphaerae bacterium]
MLRVTQTTAERTFLVFSAPRRASASAAADGYTQIADALRKHRLEIVQERVFGNSSAEAAVLAARREALQACGIPFGGPLTYVQGQPIWGEGLAGVIIHTVPAGAGTGGTRAILDHGTSRGCAWRSEGATFISLRDIRGLAESPGSDNSPPAQARRMFERADRVLREHGACYGHVVRTWIYLSNILDWYGEFNRVRNEMYGEFGLMPGVRDTQSVLPASTGIGADLAGGAACAMDLLAVVPGKDGGPVITRMGSLRQQEAFRYGSAFSRGVVVQGSHGALIEVSGTAAIDENGASLHPGDIRGQVRWTCETVASLLNRAAASSKDICAATVFMKNRGDAAAVLEVMADLGLENLPAVYVVADICRKELLFEIDAEAETRGRG